MKKDLSLFLSLALIAALLPASAASAADAAQDAADRLVYYEIMKGSDIGLELDRQPTRLEAALMILRLSGLGYTAENDEVLRNPFTDLPGWAKKQVAAAYSFGLTHGVSETTFDCDSPVSAAQFVTMGLRALQYDDAYGAFDWDSP